MDRVLCIIGTRPEAIKMAPVIRELELQADRVRSVVCSTGQHLQMLSQALDLFRIRPHFELTVMTPDQTLSELTSRLLIGLDEVVDETEPTWIVAQGDTTTAFVASLVAFYRRVRFAHVEAGLRTGVLQNPFPEEMNRRFSDALATIHFAPTQMARKALLREGISPEGVHVTGNTVVDAITEISKRPFDWTKSSLAGMEAERLVLVTMHRRESFGGPLQEICSAIRDLAHRFSGERLRFVLPVHLNPNVRQPVLSTLSGLENVVLVEPLDYLSLVHLMRRADLILTDSGGIQEEAPTFGVPVLVMRDTTERPEGVEAGMVQLVGTKRKRIVEEAARILADPAVRSAWPRGKNPYGDGRAAERIVSLLLNHSIRQLSY